MTKLKTFLVAGVAAAITATAAEAHVTFVNGTAKPDGYVVLQLQVPHGCAGKATNEVQVKLPAGFYGAKPQPKPGWDLEVIKGDYAKPYDNHGKTVTSGPLEIRWKNGELADEFYDTFVILGKIAGVAEGTMLAFPTVQLCGTDRQAWDEVAAPGVDPHSLKDPAPLLKITASKDMAASGHDHGAKAAMAPASVGPLKLEAGFLKAMLPGQPVGGGYVTIANTGSTDDTLVSATSPRAAQVELHEMIMAGDVMKMRKLDTGIALPAGHTVELKPGGLHLMFMQVKEPFMAGDKVPVTLEFEKAGRIDLILPVGEAAGAHVHN
jgi:periplasmic copper chaperone A